ncbi:MAG TPA: M17 family peptidase N-terminal domain-containing protein [Polyangia bacterium]|jgi:hypothetical protein
MIQISFVGAELGRWDVTQADAIAVGIFADQRPLRGPAGLLDWRLCGRLSRLIRQGRLGGEYGEALLLPAVGRLPMAKVLLLGVGAERDFGEERYRDAVRRMQHKLLAMGASRYLLAPPGRESGRIGPRRALEMIIEESRQLEAEVVVIESAAGQKEMAEVLRGRR